MTTFSLATAGLAFLLALAIGRPMIKWLRTRSLGKAISDEGPQTHHVKAGTPTMGGLIIFITVAILTVATNVVDRESILLPLAAILVLGGIGASGSGLPPPGLAGLLGQRFVRLVLRA